MNPETKDDDMKNTDTMLMPGVEATGVNINDGERNFLARHINRVLNEERRFLTIGHPHDEELREWPEVIDCFKRIAVMVALAADVGWCYEELDGGRFDLCSLPPAQVAVWVRKFIDADRSMFAFGAGRLVPEAEHVRAVSPIAVALEREIGVGAGLLSKLEGEQPTNEFGDC
jgi:hypothetical protein